MNLLDSNIVIAGASPSSKAIDRDVFEKPYSISVITRIEVLGFHQLTSEDYADLLAVLAGGKELPLDEAVAERAIQLRKQRRMGLGDAIIAATALVHDLPLVTRNLDDFKHVASLMLKNPFTSSA
jgi:hypothetical protein